VRKSAARAPARAWYSAIRGSSERSPSRADATYGAGRFLYAPLPEDGKVVLDFNVYLTGYDVQTINLRDILINGTLPQTASAGQDPNDKISPKGPKSQDINFASCNGQLPPPPLPPSFIQHLALSLTGKGSPLFGGLCSGRNLGDNILRGYITVDTVNNCTFRNPGSAGYFAPGGTGDATDQNVLWGAYFYVNNAQNLADGNPLVHIEASATNPPTTIAGAYTFYGRYDTPAFSAADTRQAPIAPGTTLTAPRTSSARRSKF